MGNLQDHNIKRSWDKARKKGLELQSQHLAGFPSAVSRSIADSFGLTVKDSSLFGTLDK